MQIEEKIGIETEQKGERGRDRYFAVAPVGSLCHKLSVRLSIRIAHAILTRHN